MAETCYSNCPKIWPKAVTHQNLLQLGCWSLKFRNYPEYDKASYAHVQKWNLTFFKILHSFNRMLNFNSCLCFHPIDFWLYLVSRNTIELLTHLIGLVIKGNQDQCLKKWTPRRLSDLCREFQGVGHSAQAHLNIWLYLLIHFVDYNPSFSYKECMFKM